jgi:hypothetical protein
MLIHIAIPCLTSGEGEALRFGDIKVQDHPLSLTERFDCKTCPEMVPSYVFYLVIYIF